MRVENIFTRVHRIPSNTKAYIIWTALSQWYVTDNSS